MSQPRALLRPGDRAPDLALPSATDGGTVALAEHLERSPVLLALFRGLYCPFCRRQVVSLGLTAERLRAVGVGLVGVLAAPAEPARHYFRHRRPRYPLAADPELVSHRAFGVPQAPLTGPVLEAATARVDGLAREAGLLVPPGGGWAALDREDGVRSEDFAGDLERRQAQLVAQFFIDRGRVIRWVNLETLETLGRFPSETELLSVAREILEAPA